VKERGHLEDTGGYKPDNIKMNVKEMYWACADWIYERQDRTLDGLL
jgi:hypothetical protein